MYLKNATKTRLRGAIRRAAAILAAAVCVFALTATAAAGTTDIYYAGETGNPRGSYFDAPLTSGALVASFEWLDALSGGFVNGLTLVNKIPMPDVLFANQLPGIEYRYAFGEYTNADAYYVGAAGNPSGSYLPGTLSSGAYVDTYVDATGWAVLGSGGNITAPALSEGVNPIEHKLTVAASDNGLSSVVYANTFRWDFALDPNTGGALIGNGLDSAFKGRAILAVYDAGGRLVATEEADVSVEANTAYKLTFELNASKYPTSEFSYAMFLWDYDFFPVFHVVKP